MAITVNIEISKEGEIKIEPTGYKDSQCMTDLVDMEAHLKKAGIKTTITDQKRRSESYVKTTQRTRNYTQ